MTTHHKFFFLTTSLAGQRQLNIVFLDNSPTVSYNGTISAYFRTNRHAYTITCKLLRVDDTEMDCEYMHDVLLLYCTSHTKLCRRGRCSL